MTNDELEALLLKYVEQAQSGQTPDLTKPPYDSPEFQRLLKTYRAVDTALKAGRELNPAATGLPSIPDVQIVSEIGRGGMGRVFLAKDPDLDRVVAVKVIPKFNNEQVIQRFKQESKILAKFTHPNIVIIHSHGETADYFYYVMQYLEGATLDKIVELAGEDRFANASEIFKYIRDEIKDLPDVGAVRTTLDRDYIRAVVGIMKQAADALACAHDAGVIHRDVKPQNIMYDTYGHVKIMDFGISKSATASLRTLTHEVVGTPYYISPEMVQDRAVTPQSDLYSLGVVFYEMLGLKLPFDEKSIDKLYASIREKDPPDIRAICGEVPAELAAIVEHCLEKDPADRYPDMRALKADLDAFLVGASPRIPRRPASSRNIAIAAGVIVTASAIVYGTQNLKLGRVVAPAALTLSSPAPSSVSVTSLVQVDSGIRIELSTNKPDTQVFRNNEKLKIHVRSARDGYLRIFYRQADHQWVPLTLDAGTKVYPVRASIEYAFPMHDQQGYPIETPPAGEETILAVVSSIPYDALIPQPDAELAQTALSGRPLPGPARPIEPFEPRGIRNPESPPSYNSSALKIFTTE